MKMNSASPIASSAADTDPARTEFALRTAIVKTCQRLHDEQLDALGLLSLSHRAARSAAPGMLSLSGPGTWLKNAGDLPWHALAPERLGWAMAAGGNADNPAPGTGTAGGATTIPDGDPSGAAAVTDAADPWLALHRALLCELAQVHCVLLLAPVHATALACMATVQRDGLPPFHPALATFGADDLACADGLAATATAVESVLTALGGRHACLLANLGMLVTGQSLPQAAERARRLEALARTYCTTLQCGDPTVLEAGRMHDTRQHWQVPR